MSDMTNERLRELDVMTERFSWNGAMSSSGRVPPVDVTQSELRSLVTELLERRSSIPQQAKEGDGWVEWGGGECPVDPNTMVQFKLRNGSFCASGIAGEPYWTHDPETADEDIIAYRIVPTPPASGKTI